MPRYRAPIDRAMRGIMPRRDALMLLKAGRDMRTRRLLALGAQARKRTRDVRIVSGR